MLVTSPYRTITWDIQQASSIGAGAECEVFDSLQVHPSEVVKLPFPCNDHPFDTHCDWVNYFMDLALEAWSMDIGPRVTGMVVDEDDCLIGYITERVRTVEEIVEDIMGYCESVMGTLTKGTDEMEALTSWMYSLEESPDDAIYSYDTVEALLCEDVKDYVVELEQIDEAHPTFCDAGVRDLHMWNMGILDDVVVVIDHGPMSMGHFIPTR